MFIWVVKFRTGAVSRVRVRQKWGMDVRTKECVSVIVPVYNAEKYLRRCVDSIRNQTFGALEILLIDDGSKDSSGAVCDAFAGEDERVTVKHVQNRGVSAARNLGLDSCHGEYVTFVDADDYLEPEFIETLLEMLHRDQTSVAVCANGTVHEAVKMCECVMDVEKEFSYGIHLFGCFVWGKIYKREVLEQLRFQGDLSVGEDTLFFGQVLVRLPRLSYTDRKLYHYMYNTDSVIRSSFSESRYTEITAWQRLCDLYQDAPERYGDCMAGYVDRCRCMYVLMRRGKIRSDSRYAFLLGEVRRNYKYTWRYGRTWAKKIYTAFFALTPRIFCVVYSFLLLLHMDEVIYGHRDRNTY